MPTYVAALVAFATMLVAILSARRLRRERERMQAVLEQCKRKAESVPTDGVDAALNEYERKNGGVP
jgi:hypothetical protein